MSTTRSTVRFNYRKSSVAALSRFAERTTMLADDQQKKIAETDLRLLAGYLELPESALDPANSTELRIEQVGELPAISRLPRMGKHRGSRLVVFCGKRCMILKM